MEYPGTIGHPVAMLKFNGGTNIFLFWSYGNSVDIKGPAVMELAIKTIEAMGKKLRRSFFKPLYVLSSC